MIESPQKQSKEQIAQKSSESLESPQKTAQKDAIKFEQFSEKYIESGIQLLEDSYYAMNPIYIGLKMERSDFKDFLRPAFEDQRNWELSIVAIDTTDNDKVVGVKIVKDFSTMHPEPEVFNHPKKDLKEKLDFMVFEQEIVKKHPKGYGVTNLLWGVDPKCAGKGLGKAMVDFNLKQLYKAGYTRLINLQYNQVSVAINIKYGGKSQQTWKLNDIELEGEKIYADNKDGATLAIFEFSEQTMGRLYGEKFLQESNEIRYQNQRIQGLTQNMDDLQIKA